VTDESTKNMVHNNAGIKEVLAKYPDQDFKFFSFPGKPSFAATGRMALDVDDIVDDFEKMYTYRYANGTIYRINATFDSEENTLNFRTNKLDNFFVTNKFIEDGTVVSKDDVTDSDDTTSTPDENKGNPSTGASDMINAAVAAAFAGLAGVGALAAKKRSK
jgi:LPXTG-motif cell wall-anchored protein